MARCDNCGNLYRVAADLREIWFQGRSWFICQPCDRAHSEYVYEQYMADEEVRRTELRDAKQE